MGERWILIGVKKKIALILKLVMNKGKNLLTAIICITVANFLTSCGTLGGIGDTINFPTSKKKLEIAMDSLYIIHPEYKIPREWETYNSWHQRGYDFLESRIFYFKSFPEEMYYMTFIGDSVMLADTTKI